MSPKFAIDDRIIAYGDLGFFKLMCQAEIIYMDGTFKSVPSIFYQLYTLHCPMGRENQIFPVVYALLPNKTHATYRRLFQLIKQRAHDLGLEFNPKLFQLDYEIGVMKAIKIEFPLMQSEEIKVRGCFFHYSQAIWRKVRRL